MTESRSIVIRVLGETFDDEEFPLGVIRITPDETVTYMNRALGGMLGGELRLGMRVSELSLDDKNQAMLRDSLRARFEQRRGTGYPLTVTRQDLGTVVNGRVAAVPEYEEDGCLKGAIGFVVDESLETTAMGIYREMEQACDPNTLLREVARHLRSVLYYDSFMVTAVGEDERHLRNMFETPDAPLLASPYRWWPAPDFVQEMVRNFVPGPLDLDAMFEQHKFAELARTNEAMRAFRARGFRYALRMSVRSQDRQVAILTLLRLRGKPPFTEANHATCKRLPLVDAVAWAMALDRQLQHDFAIRLVGSLTEIGDHASAVAQRLVDSLWEQFKWEHVSLFRVLEDEQRVRLVCQAKESTRKLRPDYAQSIERGLLGRCARTAAAVNVGNVDEDLDYVVGVEGVKSELVIPLPGKNLLWLLNIESSIRDAFGAEEQHAVEMLLRVTAFVLERAAVLELHTAIMDNVADAIIQTNERNNIRNVNQACLHLLGYTREQMVNRNLSSFLALGDESGRRPAPAGDEVVQPWDTTPTDVAEVEERASSLIHSNERGSEVVRFVKADGSTISVLLSMATIPIEYEGKVFIASDLSGKQYRERVGRLMPIFRQLASEIRVPLAMAATFLEDSSSDEELDSEARKDLLKKTQAQIRKADFSVERVMHAAGAADGGALDRTSFDLARLIRHLEGDLPADKSRALRVNARAAGPLFVSAAYSQLLFCVESLMAYLLRAKMTEDVIEMETGHEQDGRRAYLALRLCGPDGPGAPRSLADRTANEMLMIEAVVPTLMERMAGSYVAPAPEQPQFKLVLSMAE
jgi:PAS domain-containing protein